MTPEETVGVCERCGRKGTKQDCLPDEHMGFAVCPRCSRSHFRIPLIFIPKGGDDAG